MELDWDTLLEDAGQARDGDRVEMTGHMVFPDARQPARARDTASADTFLLVRDPACCSTCGPWHPAAAVEIYAEASVPWHAGPMRVTGVWQALVNDAAGWRFRIAHAQAQRIVDPAAAGMTGRRGFLKAGVFGAWGGWTAMAGLSGCGATGAAAYSENSSRGGAPNDAAAHSEAQALAWMRDSVTVDMHSHSGRMTLGRDTTPRPFTAVASPMRGGGMNVVCLAIVTDSSADHIVESASGRRRIVAYREPAPGEMSSRGEASFARLHELIAQQGLGLVKDAATLQAARAGVPSIVVAAEGADFLEGDLARLDDAYTRHALRHLQLTHYRVNELGDIQTAPPVHHGLTPFGAEVIKRCNRLGLVVDVAHGTYDLVKRAAEVTERPLVLSHTALAVKPSRYSRAISADHARVIAGTGGVIGVWPVSTTYPDLASMAQGMQRLADLVGVDHVGLGTDMLGLLAPSVVNSYRKLPQLALALVGAGFSQAEARQILGGNYARVFAASMAS